MSVPSSNNLPAVGGVKAPSMAKRVDLPDPERPTIDTNSPSCNVRLESRTASYSGAAPYRLVSECAKRVISTHFCLNQRVRRHSTYSPCRNKSAGQAEDARKDQHNDRTRRQYARRWPGERSTE